MEGTLREDFARIIALARAKLTDVRIEEEIDPTRAILSIEGRFAGYRVFIRETAATTGRRYSYYVLKQAYVLFAFDNHADRHSLRLKYGKDIAGHLHELIPHQHGAGKETTELTEEWSAERFLTELEARIKEALTE
jgi:hypothetical protein